LQTALVLFAHGSRDPAWAEPFRRLQRRIAQRLPGTPVELAFLEQMQPSLAEAVAALAARGVERISVVPLFMAQGSHLRLELPRIVEQACASNPGVVVRTSAAVGDVEALQEAIADWAVGEHRETGEAPLDGPLA
jgi:sirohydrochlorin cobaltochelatase